ncbi:MAG: hypothetical protein ACPLW9_00440, partial [Minisyncoccales bacterium]
MKIFLRKNIISLISLIFSLILISLVLFYFFDFNFNLFWRSAKQWLWSKDKVLAMESYLIPRFPQRIVYLIKQIDSVAQEITTESQKISTLTAQCDCQKAQSVCLPPAQEKITPKSLMSSESLCQGGPVTGNPCPEIKDLFEVGGPLNLELKKEELLILKTTLETEWLAGLKKEVQTFDPKTREILETNLNKIVDLSNQLIGTSKKLHDSTLECSTQNCFSNCRTIWGWQACLGLKKQDNSLGQILFGINVELTNLELGQVQIKNINLGLPQSIDLPSLPTIPSFTIDLPSIDIDLSQGPVNLPRLIYFHTPSLSLPSFSPIQISCPNTDGVGSATYSYDALSNLSITEFTGDPDWDWHYAIFKWLNQQCVALA